jgi:hypothetical protein
MGTAKNKAVKPKTNHAKDGNISEAERLRGLRKEMREVRGGNR